MSEATSTAAAGIALSHGVTGATSASTTGSSLVQVAAVFFVAMGLQPEHLFAGMWGALASIVLLGNIPLVSDTIAGRINQGFQRFVLVIVCAVMAGYTTPFLAPIMEHLINSLIGVFGAKLPTDFRGPAQMFHAFVVGAGGHQILPKLIQRYARVIDSSARNPSTTTGTH